MDFWNKNRILNVLIRQYLKLTCHFLFLLSFRNYQMKISTTPRITNRSGPFSTNLDFTSLKTRRQQCSSPCSASKTWCTRTSQSYRPSLDLAKTTWIWCEPSCRAPSPTTTPTTSFSSTASSTGHSASSDSRSFSTASISAQIRATSHGQAIWWPRWRSGSSCSTLSRPSHRTWKRKKRSPMSTTVWSCCDGRHCSPSFFYFYFVGSGWISFAMKKMTTLILENVDKK